MTELLNWLFQRDTLLSMGGAALAFLFAWWVLSVGLSLLGAALGWVCLAWTRLRPSSGLQHDALLVGAQATLPTSIKHQSTAPYVERDMAALQTWAHQHGVHWLDKPAQELAMLAWANLYRANVAQAPEALCSMPVLQRLDLRFNPLTHLPERMGELQALQSLDVYEARLAELPASFTQLHRLSYCQLVAQLTALPADFGNLRALTFPDVSDNQLAALPESMRHLSALQTLKLARNHLTELPDWIGQLPALVLLDVRGNPLTSLPPSLSHSPTLRHLAHDRALPAVDLARWRAMRAGPLGNIQVTFAKQLSYFGHELPVDDVRLRRRGMLCADEDGGDYGHGDTVRYLFGQDDHGEYLDYYLRHRLAGDQHVRIREDGSTEDLDVVPNWRACADAPAEDARLQTWYVEEVNRISRMLDANGFD